MLFSQLTLPTQQRVSRSGKESDQQVGCSYELKPQRWNRRSWPQNLNTGGRRKGAAVRTSVKGNEGVDEPEFGDDWLEQPSIWSSVMSLRQEIDLDGILTAEERTRQDEQDDSIFYSYPRFVQYVDEDFCRRLRGWYSEHLRPGDRVLDLCSAYDSHLPCTLQLGAVQGHGMCQGELAANPVLRSYVVCDLNKNPKLSLQGEFYDAVLCCMGLQYLTQPEKVVAEVHRVLKPGGKFLISFSSHCFPEKTLAAWLERTLEQQVELVKSLLLFGGFVNVEGMLWIPEAEAPNVVSDSIMEYSVDGKPQMSEPHCEDDMSGAVSLVTNGNEEMAKDMLSQMRPDSNRQRDPFCAVMGMHAAGLGGQNHTSVSVASDTNSAGSESWQSGFDAASNKVLDEMEMWDGIPVGRETLERWAIVYRSLCHEAEALGVPKYAIPRVDGSPTFESLKEKRDLLRGIVASFMSSGL